MYKIYFPSLFFFNEDEENKVALSLFFIEDEEDKVAFFVEPEEEVIDDVSLLLIF
jgi:hypothetical protein